MEFPRPRQPREWQEPSPEYWPDPLAGPWLVTIGWREIRGRWEPIGIKVEATEPTGPIPLESHILTAKLVREIPVGDLVKSGRRKSQQVAEIVARSYEEQADPKTAQEVRDYGRRFEARAGRPPMLSDAHYRQVADVWINAWSSGESPTKTVQDHYHVSYPTAARWATESRRRGFLQAYAECKAGGVLPPEQKEGE